MNYIYEIKRFYDRQLSERLSAGQIALWHALMEISNRNGWQEWFTAPTETLTTLAGSTAATIRKNLKILCERNYIKIDKNFIKILIENDSNPDSHLIYNKTKLNQTKLNKRKDVSDNGEAKLHGQDSLAVPGGIKL